MLKELLMWATKKLSAVHDNHISAEQEARWLCEEFLRENPYVSNFNSHQMINEQYVAAFKAAVEDRVTTGKPLAYILGWVNFCNIPLKVTPPVLIPRNETEELVWELIKIIPENTSFKILDLCTGSGCIAIALAAHRPMITVIGVDINQDALALATTNAAAFSGDQVQIISSDLFSALDGQTFDMIVSNPPYITDEEWGNLSPDVKEWESPQALRGGTYGLDFYEKIISKAHLFLKPRTPANAILPELVLEYGWMQAHAVRDILMSYGFTSQSAKKDMYHNERVVYASRNND